MQPKGDSLIIDSGHCRGQNGPMSYQNLTVIFPVVILYSVMSRGLEQEPVNGALLFYIIGFLPGYDGLARFQIKHKRERAADRL